MAMEATSTGQYAAARALLDRMRRRRVTRAFSETPVAGAQLQMILEAGRWASSASNLHIHKFVLVTDPGLVALVKQVAPGILGNPAALIVICTDLARCAEFGVRAQVDRTRYVDVGTAAMNMLLQAQELGLGACPVTSYSQRAVAALLSLPETLIPELMVLLGTPVPEPRTLRPGASTRLTVTDLTFVATTDRGLQPYTYKGSGTDAARP
jgi:nitroreductase